jgi:hypothetical protein
MAEEIKRYECKEAFTRILFGGASQTFSKGCFYLFDVKEAEEYVAAGNLIPEGFVPEEPNPEPPEESPSVQSEFSFDKSQE